MHAAKVSLSCLGLLLASLLVTSSAGAACEVCKGHFTNRSCQEVSEGESGNTDCANDFFGNCINGQSSCTGSSCGTGDGCEEENKSWKIDWELPAGGEVLLEATPACHLPGLTIEA